MSESREQLKINPKEMIDVQRAIELLENDKVQENKSENIIEEKEAGFIGNINSKKTLSFIPATVYVASCIFNNTLYISYVILVFTLLALSFIWFPEKYVATGCRFLSTSSTPDEFGESSIPLVKLTGWVFLFLIGIVVFIGFNYLR